MYRLACAGFGLFFVSLSSAQAQVTIHVAKITCDQFVHSKISSPNIIAAWMSGYYNAKRDNRVIDLQKMHENVCQLQNYCGEGENLKMPVMTAIERVLGNRK